MQNNFWTKAQSLYGLLAAPLYDQSLRNSDYEVDAEIEADLSCGFTLDVSDEKIFDELEVSLNDFREFMSKVMDVSEASGSYSIVISKGVPAESPVDAAEAFEIRVSSTQCEIIAPNSESARRGLFFLEDQIVSKRFPALSLGTKTRWTKIADRITRSPIASYRWNTGWELLDEHDYYPDEYLKTLAHCGVNGIWVAGLFRNLIRTDILPELGPKSNQLEKLKKLVKKAGRYGIKVHMFCIEPRAVEPDHEVFKRHPDIKGAVDYLDQSFICLCTSTSVVQEYIKQAVCELFSQVPDLGGIINIFNGERITNCWLSEKYAQTCPRCSHRKQIDVLAEDLNCFAEGIRRAGSKGKCLAWTYWMNPDNQLETNSISPVLDLIEKTDKDVVWLGNFEHGGKKQLGDKEISIDEYSLSFTGPADPFKQIAQKCRQTESQLFAKLQLGTTFELSSVPYIPVPGIIYDKFKKMKEHEVTGTMLSWIPGGFPSLMLKAAGLASFCESTSKDEFLANLAGSYWPSECVKDVVKAWNLFEEGMHEYPFVNRFFYYGPITRAPAYPLKLQSNPNHAHPYNWGIDANREPQPFEEDFQRWIEPFTVDEIIGQLENAAGKFNDGLQFLEKAMKSESSIQAQKQHVVAAAVCGHFQCTNNIFKFLVYRKDLKAAQAEAKAQIISQMKEVIKSQISLAADFKGYISKEPVIGYQSEILDFSYDPLLIDQAIETNKETLHILQGPDEAIESELKKQSAVIPEKENLVNVDLFGD